MTPSVKTLRTIFGENAARAKEILLMTRAQLEATPTGAARIAECYHPPSTRDLRMECLNNLGEFHGVEGFETRAGVCLYLNAGDSYALTLVRFKGSYRVKCWGDIAEKYAT